MESIKTYKAILLAVLGLVLVVSGAFFYMKGKPVAKETIVRSNMVTLEGQVTRIYEGENKLVYSMDIPETATSAVSMDDGLVKITDNGALYAAVYMSYEGGRGYSSLDYINNVIVPHVATLTLTGTTTIGETIWTTAASPNSEWHVGQVGDKQWLMVVESKKTLHTGIVEMLESLMTK
jgi:hypothetical protein